MSFVPRSSGVTALCLALAIGAVTACKTAPLVDPPRIAAATSPDASRAAIVRALVACEYVIDEESPGRIRARLQGGGWAMIVDILYDHDISIHYTDSVGLSYQLKNDVAYIHKGYNSRAEELAQEIQRQVMLVSLENRPVPRVSSPPTPTPPPASSP